MANGAKIVEYISAYMHMKHLSSKNDYDGNSSEESWKAIGKSLTPAY
jgi:hypothetical protein